MTFFHSKFVRVLTLVLLLQAVAYYAIARRSEHVPHTTPLAFFPTSVGDWTSIHEYPLEKEVEDVLKADDTMNRLYTEPSGQEAFLFIAYFKTQRNGQSPHSPKNCLPGAGWEEITADRPVLTVPDWPTPIQINRYIVQHGTDKSVTLYWYHSHNRVIASELSARMWLVADALRYHRSDTALVRIVVPVENENVDAATQTGYAFTRAVFPYVVRQFPQ